MQCVFNLWLNIFAGSPGTFFMSELPFHTLLTLTRLKRPVSFSTFCSNWCDWREGIARRVAATLEGGVMAGLLPPPSLAPPPLYSWWKERERAHEKTLFFPFFTTVREKAWEQSLQGFRNIVSVCRMKSLAIEAENERPFYSAQWEGEGITWKSSLLPTKLD